MEKTLEVIDDFFIPNDYLNVVKYCSGADYYWGERDDKKFVPTGMVHEIYDCEDTPVKESNQWIYDLFLENTNHLCCLLYTSPSPRDGLLSRMPSSA